MSDSRPNENVKPDRAENTGETPPESTPKAGDGSTSDSTGGQWAAAARDSLYSVYETALKATGIVPAKPEQVPETINFADKPILPVEKAAATELVRPAGDTKPATSDSSWFSFLKVDSLTSFFESGANRVTVTELVIYMIAEFEKTPSSLQVNQIHFFEVLLSAVSVVRRSVAVD